MWGIEGTCLTRVNVLGSCFHSWGVKYQGAYLEPLNLREVSIEAQIQTGLLKQSNTMTRFSSKIASNVNACGGTWMWVYGEHEDRGEDGTDRTVLCAILCVITTIYIFVWRSLEGVQTCEIV